MFRSVCHLKFKAMRWLEGCHILQTMVLSLCFVISAMTPLANIHAADAIEIGSTRLERSIDGDSWMLNVDADIQLGPRLEEAVNKGLPLYFILELEITKPRWYWFDERNVSKSQTYRLFYHALTRQYRVSLGAFQQTFSSLNEAISSITKIRGWKVGDVDQFNLGTTYEAQIRLRLDSSQLPKPFQVIGITNKDWALTSDWRRFIFSPKSLGQ
jgi:Domain of unknown function (DUF4390)